MLAGGLECHGCTLWARQDHTQQLDVMMHVLNFLRSCKNGEKLSVCILGLIKQVIKLHSFKGMICASSYHTFNFDELLPQSKCSLGMSITLTSYGIFSHLISYKIEK